MNDLTHSGFGGQSPAAMSTREIAELTGKQHAHVMRDARAMLVELYGEEGLSKFGSSYRNAQNKEQPEYLLPKRETLILASGYSLELRTKIIDRCEELEQAARHSDPLAVLNNPAQMRGLLLTYTERVLALENKVQDDAPKVAFADQITVSAGSVSIGQAAKILGTGRNRLMAKLREWHWVTRLGEPYQEKINSGLLDVKIGSWEHPEKGLQRSVTALVTGKGLRKLWGLFFPDIDPTYSLN